MVFVKKFVGLTSNPWNELSLLIFLVFSYFYMDKPIAIFFHAHVQGNLSHVFQGITQLGRGVLCLPLIVLVALYFRYAKRHRISEERTWLLGLMVLIPVILCTGLKVLLGRARPQLWFEDHIFGFLGPTTQSLYHSMPSGHTTVALSMALGLCLLFPKRRWLWLGFAFAVMVSRLALTCHYLSDVLFSSALVMIEFNAMITFVERQCPLYWVRLELK